MKLTFAVKKPADFIFRCLTDMQAFASYHPVITRMKWTGNGSYLAYETLTFGFVPISFTYPVVVTSLPLHNTVHFKATVMQVVTIDMKFTLREEKQYTVVEEHTVFTSLFPVRKIMEGIFKKHHTQWFVNIENAR